MMNMKAKQLEKVWLSYQQENIYHPMTAMTTRNAIDVSQIEQPEALFMVKMMLVFFCGGSNAPRTASEPNNGHC